MDEAQCLGSLASVSKADGLRIIHDGREKLGELAHGEIILRVVSQVNSAKRFAQHAQASAIIATRHWNRSSPGTRGRGCSSAPSRADHRLDWIGRGVNGVAIHAAKEHAADDCLNAHCSCRWPTPRARSRRGASTITRRVPTSASGGDAAPARGVRLNRQSQRSPQISISDR